MPEDFQEGFRRRPVGIDAVDDFFAVKVQHRFGFPFVSLEPGADDVNVGVVEPVVLERTSLHARNEVFKIAAAEIEDGGDVQKFPQHFRLTNIARDAVQHKRVALGMEMSGCRKTMDVSLPKLDRRLVGHQFAAAGILNENLPEWRFRTQVAEHVATTAMDETRNRAEDFSMRALARTRRAEHEDGAIFQVVLGLSWIS
jgi:hypothetical protein